jgi:predicted Fe-S protein YdhL (DUF1289 family)
MTKDEALDLALEALKLIEAQDQGCGGRVTEAEAWRSAQSIARKAITAIKQARSAPVQEPVAYLFTNVQSGDIEASTNPDHKEGEREMWYREPLVRPPAAQRQWVGLSDDEVEECVKCCRSADGLARAIEAKLKAVNGFHSTEKNNG